jgi:dolichyl-phosphate-mannose--protein O-mannosyl transferase
MYPAGLSPWTGGYGSPSQVFLSDVLPGELRPTVSWTTLTLDGSVKMVGLFVTALVGLYTIEDLWEKFGDIKMSVVSFPLSFV